MNARTQPGALLIFSASGGACGLIVLAVTNDINLTSLFIAGVLFSFGVALGVALTRALESITWRFSMRHVIAAHALLAISYPIASVAMDLARKAHDDFFAGAAGKSGFDIALLTGSAINAIIIGTGLHHLTGHRGGSLTGYMMFTPPLTMALGMLLPYPFRNVLGVSGIFVAMNAFLTLLCGVWLVRGASMKSETA